MNTAYLISYLEDAIECGNYMALPELDAEAGLLSTEELQLFNSQLAESGVSQKLILQERVGEEKFWIFLLQHGYMINREDCRAMNSVDREYYKRRATQARLAHRLYEQNRSDLIPLLFDDKNGIIDTCFVLEALEKDSPQYFNYRANPWQNIANNALQHYKTHWPFMEAAFKKHNKWQEIYANESFRRKHAQLDMAGIMKQMRCEEYMVLRLLYSHLEVPELPSDRVEAQKETDVYEQANQLFVETDLSKMLYSLCTTLEKQQRPWGYKDIPGETADEKLYSIWCTCPQKEFFTAMFKLAGGSYGYTLLNCVLRYTGEKNFMEKLYKADILPMFRIGLASRRIYNVSFLIKIWEMGFRYYKEESWDDCKRRYPMESIRLFCLDKLAGRHIPDRLLEEETLRVIGMIEAIKTNDLFFTNTPNWKSYINGTRGCSAERPMNRLWGYIDMALDAYRHKDGMTMREYLIQKEPGIRMEKSSSLEEDDEFLQVLRVLYPEVYDREK